MADEYTPSPETALKTAAWQAGWDADEFARVLAAHDAEVAAKAWDQAIGSVGRFVPPSVARNALRINPYRENGATDD